MTTIRKHISRNKFGYLLLLTALTLLVISNTGVWATDSNNIETYSASTSLYQAGKATHHLGESEQHKENAGAGEAAPVPPATVMRGIIIDYDIPPIALLFGMDAAALALVSAVLVVRRTRHQQE